MLHCGCKWKRIFLTNGLMLELIFLFIFVILLYAPHPFSFGATILTLRIVLGGVIRGTLGGWYGFVLFLIFVGGLLVLFAYTCALTPNLGGAKEVPKGIAGLIVGVFFSFFFIWNGLSNSFFDRFIFGRGVSMAWGVLVTSFVWDVRIVWLVRVLFLAIILVAHFCKRQGFPLRAFRKK